MHRSQVRATVRWESIIIAVFGATLGMGVGIFFGWALVEGMADQGIDTLTVSGATPRPRTWRRCGAHRLSIPFRPYPYPRDGRVR
jgi:ABC-type antimicrobial peptide transport system permease subunit